MRTVRLNAKAWIGMAVFAAIALAALSANWISPGDPMEQDLLYAQLPPAWAPEGSMEHFFGTDSLGRDILARLIFATRPALLVALSGALGAGVLGTLLGFLAGGFGGRVDMLISRVVDIWMSFPAVLLSIVLVAIIGAGLHAVIIAITIIDWTRFCRVIRIEVMQQGRMDYVLAARALGLGRVATLVREIGPNVVPLLVTMFTLEMGIAVVVESILSFVGLSVSSGYPTWGGMIQEGRLYVNQTPWLLGLPVACIVATVLGFNALGDGLRESLDPARRR